MEAGSTLDRLMAKEVFGYEWITTEKGWSGWTEPVKGGAAYDMMWRHERGLDQYPYSKEIEFAWMVVEKMTDPTSTGGRFIGEFPAASRFMYLFENARLWSMSAQEAAAKICELALKALDIEIPVT